MGRPRRAFTREFKREAVKLVTEGAPNRPGRPGSQHHAQSAAALETGGVKRLGGGVLCEALAMRYRAIQSHAGRFPVTLMCRTLAVSSSGYYAWAARPERCRAAENRRLVAEIRVIHAESRGTYGSPRVQATLQAQGQRVSAKRVARRMHASATRAKTVKQWRATTDSAHPHPVVPNTLNRHFAVAAPNRVWAGDITYVWTAEGWLYLAVVLDLYSRRVIAWGMGRRLTQELATEALAMAVAHRRPATGVLHHTDRGAQYAATAYRDLLARHGLTASMSRRGNCWDNAVVESFFHTLKTELVYHRRYTTREEAQQDIFEWIDVFFNRVRRHSTLGYRSPTELETTAGTLN